MAKCSGCGKFLSPSGAATCTTCSLKFHKLCVGLPDSTSLLPTDWICPECKNKQRKGDNSSTPVKGICGTLVLPPSCSTVEVLPALPPATTASSDDSEVRAMRRELAAYMAEQREFRTEMRVSVANIVVRMDGFERRLEAVESGETSASASSAEIAELQQAVVQLKLELNERDQEALLSDLDIGHLPEEKGENVQHTVTVLAAKLGVTLKDHDIVFAERVGAFETGGGGGGAVDSKAGGRPRRVVVRLAQRRLRDELLSAARVRRNVTTADVGLVGPPRRVYLNERLTRSNRQLFHRVREECRKRQWRYSWTKKGRVYARQGDGKQAFIIRSDVDFFRVFGTDTV